MGQEEPQAAFVTLLCHYYSGDEYLGQAIRTVNIRGGLPLSFLVLDLHYGRRERDPTAAIPDNASLRIHNAALKEIFRPAYDVTEREEYFIRRATTVRVLSFDLWHDAVPW
jgi:hypothetical protein